MNTAWKISDESLAQLNEGYYNVSGNDENTESTLSAPITGLIVTTNSSLTTGETEFLRKVMASISKDPAQYTVCDDFDSNDLKPGQSLIQFGSKSSQIPLYTPKQINNGMQCWCDSIPDIMNDNGKKRALWECLKTSF